MNKSILWIVLAIIVVLGLGWWLYSMNQPEPEPAAPAPEVAGTESQFVDGSKDGAADTGTTAGAATVTYTDAGFSPSTLTVKEGTAVTFLNQSSRDMWIASDEHPTHTGYDGTNKDTHCAPGYAGAKPLDECGTGASYTFIFSKAGTFGFHNHPEDDDHGTVIVTQ